ncbi:hypothetical protein N7493_003243 [Penicillium malachiteum]|uniref:Uncharacterized protein n=1 Tax=Penicillium malachiteum TaxID=1324776 RepID=A0AAD6MZJ3_9EURO|nr:hypothetical protein N7493_003243 [Penicillium malachiteum]
MTIVPKSNPNEYWMVDDLWFAIQASIVKDNLVESEQRILRIWEYYSSKLEQNKAQLKSFNEWLSTHVSREGMRKAANIINPSLSLPSSITPVPTGSLLVEWIPQDDTESSASSPDREEEEPPCTVLLCRMLGTVPVTTAIPAKNSRSNPPPSFPMWTFDNILLQSGCHDDMTHVKHSIALSALLFVASYTKDSQLLQTAFPDDESPRYPPIRLADSFIARAKAGEARSGLTAPVNALKRCGNGVPAQLLRDVIWSLLDTLKANPDSSMYSHILFSSLELIKLMLCSDKPQLTVDILLRLWMEFPNDSSLHRKISLANVGRRLRPEQAEEMMMALAKAVCDAIESQEKQAAGEQGKPYVKVTTAKMLAKAVGETDCISQSSRMHILQRMLDVSRHIDIRRGILDSILVLFSESNSRELYDLFSSVALSIAGPSEEKVTTEEEWIAAETQDGPLPIIPDTSHQRPLIELFVSTASYMIPHEMRSHYAENVLLPLLEESCRQNTRWLAIVCAKLGLSMPKLGITEQEVGPFAPDLVQDIFSKWRDHLPVTYLEDYHRPWAMAYLRFKSFDKIAKKLAKTKDKHLNCSDVTLYWNLFYQDLQTRPNLYSLDSPLTYALAKPEAGISADAMVNDILCRIELISKTPIRRDFTSKKWILRPNYSIQILRDLRKSRVMGSKDSFYRPTVYYRITDIMTRTIELFNATRNGDWPTKLAKNFPMTLPSLFEYEVLILPSPIYNPVDSETNSCIKIFAKSVISLIHKYATDPESVLLLQLEVLESIFHEIDLASKMECALYLGRIKHEQLGPVEACVRVKLARKILEMDAMTHQTKRKSDASCEEMVEEWKASGFDLVRQIGWGYEQSWSWRH